MNNQRQEAVTTQNSTLLLIAISMSRRKQFSLPKKCELVSLLPCLERQNERSKVQEKSDETRCSGLWWMVF